IFRPESKWSCRATTSQWRSSSSPRSPWKKDYASPSAKAAEQSVPEQFRKSWNKRRAGFPACHMNRLESLFYEDNALNRLESLFYEEYAKRKDSHQVKGLRSPSFGSVHRRDCGNGEENGSKDRGSNTSSDDKE